MNQQCGDSPYWNTQLIPQSNRKQKFLGWWEESQITTKVAAFLMYGNLNKKKERGVKRAPLSAALWDLFAWGMRLFALLSFSPYDCNSARTESEKQRWMTLSERDFIFDQTCCVLSLAPKARAIIQTLETSGLLCTERWRSNYQPLNWRQHHTCKTLAQISLCHLPLFMRNKSEAHHMLFISCHKQFAMYSLCWDCLCAPIV